MFFSSFSHFQPRKLQDIWPSHHPCRSHGDFPSDDPRVHQHQSSRHQNQKKNPMKISCFWVFFSIFPWFSHGFPMVFPWDVPQGFSRGVPGSVAAFLEEVACRIDTLGLRLQAMAMVLVYLPNQNWVTWRIIWKNHRKTIGKWWFNGI